MEPPAEVGGIAGKAGLPDQHPAGSASVPSAAPTPTVPQLFVPQFTSPSIVEVKNSLAPDPKWAPKVCISLINIDLRVFVLLEFLLLDAAAKTLTSFYRRLIS